LCSFYVLVILWESWHLSNTHLFRIFCSYLLIFKNLGSKRTLFHCTILIFLTVRLSFYLCLNLYHFQTFCSLTLAQTLANLINFRVMTWLFFDWHWTVMMFMAWTIHHSRKFIYLWIEMALSIHLCFNKVEFLCTLQNRCIMQPKNLLFLSFILPLLGDKCRQMVDLWLEWINLLIAFIFLTSIFLLNRHIVIDSWTKSKFLLYHFIISLSQLVDLELFITMLFQQTVYNIGYFLFLAQHFIWFFVYWRLKCVFVGLSLSY